MARKSEHGYNSKFVTIDKETGEEIEGIPVYVAGKVRWANYGRSWFLGFQDAFEKIALDREMTGEVTRVWHYLLSKFGFENFVIINSVEIAKKLNLQRPNVARSIKKLVEKELLIKGPKVGRSSSYRLSLDIGWKGSAKAYNENIRARQKNSAEEIAKERWKIYEQEHLPKE